MGTLTCPARFDAESRGRPPVWVPGRLVVIAPKGETLMRIAILSLGLLAAVGAVLRADEETIGLKDLPKAVRAAVKAKFPEGKLIKAAKEEDEGKTIYEVVVEEEDAKIDVAVSAKGKILEVERTIEPKELPKAVAATLKAKYPKAKIKKAERVVKYEEDEEEKFFEVLLTSKGKEDVEVKLSAKGKILDDEDDDEEDDDDKKGKKKEKDDDDDENDKKEKNEKGKKKERD
jgi:Putative beta-lactamase-inhibitor-like, PepSY-like